MSTPHRSLLDKFDDGVYAVERLIITLFFSVMTLVVFFDVTHRVFIVPDSRFTRWWAELGVSEAFAAAVLAPASAVLVAFVVCYAALRERRRQQGTRLNAAAWAAAATAALTAGLQLFLAAFPNGIVWSQTLGLSLMLWIGLIGASMAAKQRRHLALEIGSKIWPAKLQVPVRVVSGILVAVFCAFLSALAFLLIEAEYADFDPEYGTGMFSGIPLPKFVVYGILPYAFFMIVIRYLRGSFQGGEVSETDLLLAKQQGETHS